MLNQEKVAVMTRLAIEEKREPRRRFIAGHFWAADYLFSEAWKAFFAVTVAYCAVWGLWLLAASDSWSYTYHISDALALARKALAGYIPSLILGILAALTSHTRYYLKAYRRQSSLTKRLWELQDIYDGEEQAEPLQGGGSGNP